ncbi:PREDICTED: E3 ubiquitin-protein ligase MARCH6-like [Vollenhovia emeryi]|uniref:E3 ubiquitin-protein ligase MARCH6-like n=1 Tax=Vollenhovia emeryi TaxID=411798 RepID=UPI0005F46BA6|nr:PREDICTED: E3 ubiquitin-protein ligase MARCH6-like [Vollenhovia emeryi]
MSLPMDMLSTENISSDVFHGCFVVTCILFAFIGLVWLRKQILHAGGPDWLERDIQLPPVDNDDNPPQANAQRPQQPQEQRAMPPEVQDYNNILPFINPPIPQEEELHNEGDPKTNQRPIYREAAENLVNNPRVGEPEDLAEVEEANWNPMEWDRLAEELIWEHLLGWDGFLGFLKHVFWIVSLNTLFIMVFAFCPYHIGHFKIAGLSLQKHAAWWRIEGLVTTLCGYCVIGVCLVVLYTLAALLGFQCSQRILGRCYVIAKVSLLFVVEIGVLPLVCGWWLDICSLAMFDATLRDIKFVFRVAPYTCMVIYWLMGIVYIYYFVSLILLSREVLRPGFSDCISDVKENGLSQLHVQSLMVYFDNMQSLHQG